MYFETGVKYTNIDKFGKEEKRNDVLLVKAETFGSAEEQAYKWLEVNTRGESFVGTMKISNLDPYDVADGDFYFCATMILSDDDSKKSTKVKLLLRRDTFNEAEDRANEIMAEDLYYDEVFNIGKTKIIDVVDNDTDDNIGVDLKIVEQDQ